jgi:hypothetical protein
MDARQFDSLVRTVGAATSRRGALAALVTSLVAAPLPELTTADRRKGKGHDKGKAHQASSKGHNGHRGGHKKRGKGHDKRKRKRDDKRDSRKSQAGPGEAAKAPACRPAGHPCEGNQACCAGLICIASGPGAAVRCTPCGKEDQHCCANDACNDGFVCAADDTCVACGGEGEPCCAAEACDGGFDCDGQSGECVACGDAGERCCADDGCDHGLVCQADGTCACDRASCGGCRTCENGRCVVDASFVCTPSDQCHEAGVCDPQTGECTNPRKEDGASCDDGDPCTQHDSCQNGVCTGGEEKDCSSEDDACNDGVCQDNGTCGKRPKDDGTSCNADNTDCTSGDSCQNGVCTPGAGVDCRAEDDQCNRGVCQSDGTCVKEPRQDGTVCSDGDPCTQPDTCQNGSCVAGPALVCGASDECHLAGACNEATGFCSDPVAPDGTSCGVNGQCTAGECVEICIATRQACDPANDTCCGDEGAFCSDTAACSDHGEGRCCRDDGAFCVYDCDCCAGADAGGVCCQPFRQCNSSSECCEGYNCVDNVCEQACGTAHAICTNIPCCDGFRCFEGECWPNNCLALTEICTGPGLCCQDGGTVCARTVDSFPDTACCKAHNQTCRVTEECCSVEICGPEGRCCRGGFFDPDRPQVRGCSSEGGCCPGWKCNPQTDTCCAKEGQPVPPYPDGVLDCCHFTTEGGLCVCRADGQQCAAPGGNPFLSNCCDGLLCIDTVCQPPCGPWIGNTGCAQDSDCCRGQRCDAGHACVSV